MGKARLSEYYAKRDRNRGLTQAVIQIVIDAGPQGILSREVVSSCRARGLRSAPPAIRSILSRCRYAGALTYDGLYRVKR